MVSFGLLFGSVSRADAQALTFTVNTTSDDPDANAGNEICATASGECTLRAALTEANNHPGPNTIAFNIPGEGVHTIRLTKNLVLRDLTGPITIDGYTQPGASPNTDPLASNAVIKVQIEGGGYDQFHGLTVQSPDNVIRGLSFYKLNRTIELAGSDAHHNRILGNFIGDNASGTISTAHPQVQFANGVHVSEGASNNVIGGTSPADRNVISNNAHMGVAFYNSGTDSNVVVGNLIGLRPSGNARSANKGHGVDVNTGASFNIIGGTEPDERNVISGNVNEGVEISHPAIKDGLIVDHPTENQVVGNFIGTDVTGELATSYSLNGGTGVHLQDAVKNSVIRGNVIGNNKKSGVDAGGPTTTGNHIFDNRIGISRNGAPIPNLVAGIRNAGDSKDWKVGPNNIIANNPVGIILDRAKADFNTITRNSIHNNDKLGIDIQPLGSVNANDPDDTDSYANDQLNFPELASATPAAVTGTACAQQVVPKPCTVEVFVSDNDPSGYGEGKEFVGSATTGSDGAFTVPVTGVALGLNVTATATDARGNTSEFSRNLAVSDETEPKVTLSTPAEGANYSLDEEVRADYACEDEPDGSGLASCAGDVSNGAAIDTSTLGEFTFTVTAQDNAGNVSSVTHSYTVSPPDTAAPATTATLSAEPNAAGWHNKNVTMTLSAVDDGGSGVKEITYSAAGAQEIVSTTVPGDKVEFLISAEGQTTITYRATDNAGNAENENSLAIKLDKIGPSVECGTADGLWHADDVSISCTAGDDLSGLADPGDASFALRTSVAQDTEVADAQTNSREVCDVAGNCATSGPIGGNKVDKKASEITINSPVDGVRYDPGEVVTADYGCSDGGSGTASCTGDVPNGAAIDTSTLGEFTFTVTAQDTVGNSSSVTHTYTVSEPPPHAEDRFGRNVTGGWGAADRGGAYSYQGMKADFGVNGSAGTVVTSQASTTRTAILKEVSQQNVDGVFRVSTDKSPSGGWEHASFIVRHTSQGNEYRGRLHFDTHGRVLLQATKVAGGKQTSLSSSVVIDGLTHAPGRQFWVRTQVSGTDPTTIRMKVWEDGQFEPSGWQYSATDAEPVLQTAGAVGLQALLGSSSTNGPVVFSFDDFLVTGVSEP